MSLQLYSIALAILILTISRAVKAGPEVPCALPTFDNVTLLTWSCDQADNTLVQEWLFWLSYRDDKRNGDTEKAIQGVLGKPDPLLGIRVGITESGVRYFAVNTTQQAACKIEQLKDVSELLSL